MPIARLSIDLEARLAGLQAGLDKAGLLAERQAAKIDASFASLKGSALALGAGLASAFTVREIGAFINRTNEGVAALQDMATATGASVENLSALEDAAARTGSNFETVGDALIKMNRALTDAKPGTEQAAVFEALGLSIKELKALDPVEAVHKLSKAFAQFADDGNKARSVQILTGKSLKELAPLFADLAEQQQLTATLTAAQVAEAKKFNDELANMQKNATDVSRALTGPFVEALNKTIKKIRDARGFWETFKAIDSSAATLSGLGRLSGEAPVQFSDAAGAGRGFVNPSIVKPSLPDIFGDGKPKAATKAAVDEFKKYVDTLIAAQVATLDLSTEEQARYDIATNKLGKLTQAQQQQVLDLARGVDLMKLKYGELETAQEAFRRSELGDTGATNEALRLAQLDEMIAAHDKLTQKVVKSTDEWTAFAEQAARNIQDALGNTLEATLGGHFENIGQLWKSLLIRMASEAAAAQIGKELFGGFGQGGNTNIGGSVGDVLKLIGLFSADGNAFAGGVHAFKRGGILGPAGGLLDRPTIFPMANGGIGIGGEAGTEAVMPLTRGRNGKLGVQASGGGRAVALTYAPQIHIDARSDQAQVAQLVAASTQQGQQQMLEHLRAQGVLQ